MRQIVRTPKLSQKKYNWIKNRDVYLKGLPLNYNISSQIRYEKELKMLVMKMANETKKQIIKLFKSDAADDFFDQQKKLETMDESIASAAKSTLNKLYDKFYSLFSKKSNDLAKNMINDAINISKLSLKASISKLTGGLTLKTDFIPTGVKEVVKSSITENVSLIKSIPEQYFKDVINIVMHSITFGTGVKELTENIQKYYGQATRRAKNIALDQTRKAYNSINKQRMLAAGFTKFKWLHSGGGQHPRKSHIAMSGNIYGFDDLPIINKEQVDHGYAAAEYGIPGQAINCGCVMQVVYEFSENEATA